MMALLFSLAVCALMIWAALRVAAKRKAARAAMVEGKPPFKAYRTPRKLSNFYRTKNYDKWGRKLPGHGQRSHK